MTALIDSVILRRLLSLIYLIRVAFCGGRGINLQNDALAGLSDWSSPIIFDRLLDAYRFRLGDELGDGPTIRLLAYLHCQVWQALVGSDLARFRVLQHKLRNTLRRRNLSLDVLEMVDADIMSELLAIVMMRHRRSMDDAMTYHLALLEIAGRLKSTRYAAAPGR